MNKKNNGIILPKRKSKTTFLAKLQSEQLDILNQFPPEILNNICIKLKDMEHEECIQTIYLLKEQLERAKEIHAVMSIDKEVIHDIDTNNISLKRRYIHGEHYVDFKVMSKKTKRHVQDAVDRMEECVSLELAKMELKIKYDREMI
jgi:hypothetical protein